MYEKPNFYQVGSGAAWCSEFDILCIHILKGSLLEIGVDIVDKGVPIGWSRSCTTYLTVYDVLYLVYLNLP